MNLGIDNPVHRAGFRVLETYAAGGDVQGALMDLSKALDKNASLPVARPDWKGVKKLVPWPSGRSARIVVHVGDVTLIRTTGAWVLIYGLERTDFGKKSVSAAFDALAAALRHQAECNAFMDDLANGGAAEKS